jgi:hypothetical protein
MIQDTSDHKQYSSGPTVSKWTTRGVEADHSLT